MNINPKMIKKIILIVVIILVIIILCMVLLNHTEKQEISKENFQTDTEIVYTNEIKKVTQETMFYTVESCINKYYGYISQNKYNDEPTDVDNEFTEEDLQISEQLRLTALYHLLNKQYISENSITEDNVERFIKEYDEAVKFTANTMNVLENENISVYAVYGQVENYYTSEKIEDVYFIVELDEKINTFSIEPIEDVNSIDDIKLEIINEDVENNTDNKFTYTRVNEEDASRRYFELYKQLMLNNPKEAYTYLNEEYRNKRFENVENFENYISSNYQELSGITIRQYLVNRYDDYIEYVCKDQYENLYIFNVTAVKEFTAKLDTYTIPSEKFLETYEKATAQEKVQMNVDKWFSMLNTRDYRAAYNVLDETFRNDNFGSEEAFETYMREMYPLHYEISLEDFSEQSDVYTQQIKYYDITGENELRNENTIIMQLGEGTDFVMSFFVRRH